MEKQKNKKDLNKNKIKNKSKYIIKNKKMFISTSVVSALLIISSIILIIALNNRENKTLTTSSESSEIQEISNEILDMPNDEEKEIIDEPDNTSEENTENSEFENQQSNTNRVNTSNYYIKVNYEANVVTIYKKDSNGELQPIKAMTCSTGVSTPTSGVYYIQNKWVWGKLFGHTPGTYLYGQYVTKIVGNILFHSVPYISQSKSSLEYEEYDKLGTSASAGCVRLEVKNSKWIFDNIPSGTPVEFYADSNPGPLGKPATQKISSNEECRDWDPTDPDPNNPWIAYNQRIKEEQEKLERERLEAEEKERLRQEEQNKIEQNVINYTTQDIPNDNNTINSNTNNTVINDKNTINNENQSTNNVSTSNVSDNTNNVQKNNTTDNNVINENIQNNTNSNIEEIDNNSILNEIINNNI